jgi:hypothetical protein
MQFSPRTVVRLVMAPLVVGVVLFLLVEMSTRVYLFGVAGLLPSRINSVHGLPQTGFTIPSTRGLMFELKPNLDEYFKLVPFVTNSHGLRDDEYPYRKPENVFRVAVLGSSFALPAGVSIEDAFHTRLEEQLSADLAPTHFEFLNFSVGLYGPRQLLTVLETRAYAYDPDLVLLTTTKLSTPRLVDVQRQKTQEPRKQTAVAHKSGGDAAGTPWLLEKSYPILQSFFFRLLALRTAGGKVEAKFHVGKLERAFMSGAARVRGTDGASAEVESPGPVSQQPKRSWRATPKRRGDTLLDQLARTSKAMGVPIVIVRLEYHTSPKRKIDLDVAKAAAARGLLYFDTRESFQGMRAKDFWIYELDPHPNVKAQEIFAEAIAGFLRSNDLLTQKKR